MADVGPSVRAVQGRAYALRTAARHQEVQQALRKQADAEEYAL